MFSGVSLPFPTSRKCLGERFERPSVAGVLPVLRFYTAWARSGPSPTKSFMTESKLTPELLQALEATAEGPARVRLLIELLVKEGHDRHEDIVFELGLIGACNAVPAILKAANTPFQELVRWGNLQEFRRKCAYALARIGTDESRAALREMANSSEVDLREYGGEGLRHWLMRTNLNDPSGRKRTLESVCFRPKADIYKLLPGWSEREDRFCATLSRLLPPTSRFAPSSSGSFPSCAAPWSAASIGPYVVIPPPSGRVLVVDDNEDLAYLFSALVQLMGYDTHTVFSARSALRVIPSYSPHVVFSDIGMPEISGYDLARTIRAGDSAQPFLVSISGWNDAKTVAASRNAGFDLHLGKPVDHDEVRLLLLDYFRAIGIGMGNLLSEG